MKQVEVTILGQSYRLACPEDGQDALLAAVAMVDREMCAIRDAGKVRARERIAVLAALNLAYRLAEQGAGLASGGSSAVPLPPSAAKPAGMPEVDISSLMQRIDAALARDGRLL